MMAGICSSNTGSIALHERLGFTTVGVLPEVGGSSTAGST